MSECKGDQLQDRPKKRPRSGNWTNICMVCQRCAEECPWLHLGRPVPGWTAEPSIAQMAKGPEPTWHVTACPLYIPPSPERIARQRDEDRLDHEARKREKQRASYRTFY